FMTLTGARKMDSEKLELVAFSDTHGQHRLVYDVPEGDVLVFAGDMTEHGRIAEVEDFADWMGGLEHDLKVAVAGNHDYCFEDYRRGEAVEALEDNGIVYLENGSVDYRGVTFYGSPYSNTFDEYVFNEGFGNIPDRADVVITHGPPRGMLDELGDYGHIGCEELKKALEGRDLEAHIFGHVHQQHGRSGDSYNVSVVDTSLTVSEKPVELEIDL
ncbi:MAG: metallophosphoesterase, partial [Candidatus Nanohaloarchaea archaeon]